MATKLGNISIADIKGTTFTGDIESFNQGTVYHGSRDYGISIIIDAWQNLGLEPPARWKELMEQALKNSNKKEEMEKYIESCFYDSPNRPRSKFTITVTDPEITAFLRTGSWESYSIG